MTNRFLIKALTSYGILLVTMLEGKKIIKSYLCNGMGEIITDQEIGRMHLQQTASTYSGQLIFFV